MKVTINRDECTSCAQCWETCPDIFEENPDDTYSQISEIFRSGGDIATGEVPEDLEECARDAAEGCPVQVIYFE